MLVLANTSFLQKYSSSGYRWDRDCHLEDEYPFILINKDKLIRWTYQWTSQIMKNIFQRETKSLNLPLFCFSCPLPLKDKMVLLKTGGNSSPKNNLDCWMFSRIFIGSYKLEKVLCLHCTGFNYAICYDFKENERIVLYNIAKEAHWGEE